MLVGRESALFRNALKDIFENAGNVLVYGAGLNAKTIISVLKMNVNNITLVDSNPDLVGEDVLGCKVCNRDVISETGLYDKAIISVENKKDIREILDYLLFNGFDHSMIITVYDTVDFIIQQVVSNGVEQMYYSDLLLLKSSITNNTSGEFGKILDLTKKHQNRNIKEKYKEKRLNIAFLFEYASAFAFETVYRLLSDDDTINVYCFVPHLNNGEEKSLNVKSIQYLRNKGIDYFELPDDKDAQIPDEYYPDILFFQRFYVHTCVEERLWIENLKNSCILCYVPYSFWTTVYCDDTMCSEYTDFTRFIFAPSMYHKRYFENVIGRNGFGRVCFSGYPKADFITERKKKRNRKLIVFSVGLPQPLSNGELYESCLYDVINVAKNHTEIEWVLRMHPASERMWKNYSEFKDKEQFYSYLKAWENLPYGYVDYSNEYYDLFSFSDAMITDSISFMSVYQYTKNPLFVISRNGMDYNELGIEILECSYTPSEDIYVDIENFVDDVVIQGNDTKKTRRDSLFSKSFDYRYYNKGMSASSCIVKHICSLLGNEEFY